MKRTTKSFLCIGLVGMFASPRVLASDTPDPKSVTVAGSLQQAAGCAADWDPGCATTHLVYGPDSAVWKQTFDLPAGSYEYKAALDDGWTENYGAGARRGGDNITLNLASAAAVRFYYDHETHWITDSVNSVIASAPGSYQHFLGCPGDWQPDCLRAWLQDPRGTGVSTFATRLIPAGSYETKVAINESWSENYGQGGTPGGANIPFTVPADGTLMLFSYVAATHLLTVAPAPAGYGQPASVTLVGDLQSELGCSGDWQPDCAASHLAFDAAGGVWQGTFAPAAGSYQYKVAIDDSWTENYGANAAPNGANIGLTADGGAIAFFYDHRTHWVTSDWNSVIATVPGDFQQWLGCPGNWQPECMRSWLEDPTGSGSYSFTTRSIPAGNYQGKVAINRSWSENYGAGGAPGGANIGFTVPKSGTPMTFTYDPSTHVLTVSASGGPAGNLGKARAHWVSRDTLAWSTGPIAAGTTFWLTSAPDGGLTLASDGVKGGTSVPLTVDPAGLPAGVKEKFPHLASYTALRLAADQVAGVPALLKGQTAISAQDADGTLLDATSIQIPGVLDDLYTYGGPLGVSWSGSVPTLRVWAPTAKGVALVLYPDSNPATTGVTVTMTPDPVSGVWSATGSPDWKLRYYQYQLDLYVRRTGKVERNLVSDPYSLSLSLNGWRSQIVDLDDPALKPPGWDTLRKPHLGSASDITLYELHVRDFSASDASVPAGLRGTFRAFASRGDGMRHLAFLARAGLTHVHLLPAFDISSVDEDRSTWLSPGDLTAFPPDSDRQQAAVGSVRGRDGFNWGYDPFHFLAPEGSYSTNPDGPQRILEFREMVQGLSKAGLRVVMDSVFNHTTDAGQDPRSVLDQVVPGYYHRLNLDGDVETSSCCQNTATEHAMMEKLMIDALLVWARDYKVDGFRFDLMGHHMKSNIVKAQQRLAALTEARDGVDGRAIYLYGEGWNFGEVANNARGVNATQANMAGTGVGSFNDRLRDGARGGGPFSGVTIQGFLTGLYTDPNATGQGTPAEQRQQLLLEQDWIRVGLAGGLKDFTFTDRNGHVVKASAIDYNGQPAGYTAAPRELINYVSAHDNETLFDAVQLKAPASATLADRVRMHELGISLVGLGQGIPFFHAGDEMLRSKDMDRNSYDSGDWFNRLDFTYQSNNWGIGLPPAGDNQSNWPVMRPLLADPGLKAGAPDIQASVIHFAGTLAIRRSSHLFRLRTAAEVQEKLRFHNTGPQQIPGLIVMSLSEGTGRDWGRCTGRPVGGRGEGEDHDFVVVLFNADPKTVTFTDPAFQGKKLQLHPVQYALHPGAEELTFQRKAGTFTVPGRTTAVFVCSGNQGEDRPPEGVR